MQVDDLFTKIGILTVENDMLKAQLNAAKERIQELERSLADARAYDAQDDKEASKEK